MSSLFRFLTLSPAADGFIAVNTKLQGKTSSILPLSSAGRRELRHQSQFLKSLTTLDVPFQQEQALTHLLRFEIARYAR